MDGVEHEPSERVRSPTTAPDENSRDVMLDSNRASAVLAHLEKYEYVGIEYVAISLMGHTTMRTGGG